MHKRKRTKSDEHINMCLFGPCYPSIHVLLIHHKMYKGHVRLRQKGMIKPDSADRRRINKPMCFIVP